MPNGGIAVRVGATLDFASQKDAQVLVLPTNNPSLVGDGLSNRYHPLPSPQGNDDTYYCRGRSPHELSLTVFPKSSVESLSER